MSITGHYIDAPPERPLDWELRSDQLAFTALEGNHSGKNIAKYLVRTVKRYGIVDKVGVPISLYPLPSVIQFVRQVGWITADNATNNDTAIKAFSKAIDPRKQRWDPDERRIMYVDSWLMVLSCSESRCSDVSRAIGVSSMQFTWDQSTSLKRSPRRSGSRC